MASESGGSQSRTGLALIIAITVFTVAIITLIVLIFSRGTTVFLQLTGGAIIGLAGTAFTAYVAFMVAKHQVEEQAIRAKIARREDLTFELHRDFSSDIMLHARADADKLALKHWGKDYGALYDQLPELETRCMFLVTNFYERLYTSIKHHRLDNHLVPELFGPLYYWWHINHFEKLLIKAEPEWPVSKYLAELHQWFQNHSGAEDIRTWVGYAEKDRQKREKKISSGVHA